MPVGIVDLELYFPKLCVNQSDLEIVDNCKGKYTAGLGQATMAVPSLLEDSISMALTAVNRLMRRHGSNYTIIGRLDIGTESSVDLSKSIKSNLMILFEKSRNFSVLGADNVNACYGGTAAVFNTINWIQSENWDGKLGLVVATDIAVYGNDDPGARATGGACAISLLIGTNPIIEMENTMGHFMANNYDFYKPLNLKFPKVDGKLSLITYIKSLIHCYVNFNQKITKNQNFNFFEYFDFLAFHSPYTKLAKKSLSYLSYFIAENSELLSKYNTETDLQIQSLLDDFIGKIEHFHMDSDQKSRMEFEKSANEKFSDIIKEKLENSLLLSRDIGNCYTASVFLCLLSILNTHALDDLVGKRIGLYSYGSGSLSSLYSMKITSNADRVKEMVENVKKQVSFLEKRKNITPEAVFEISERRVDCKALCESVNTKNDLNEFLFNDTFYLSCIDEKYRRFYQLHEEN